MDSRGDGNLPTQDRNESDFALALNRVLDKTGLFSRAQWAEYLDVSEADISQWLDDKTIPRSDILFVTLDTLSGSDVPQESVSEFRTMAEKLSTEVSPNGEQMLPSVSEYMIRPMFVPQ